MTLADEHLDRARRTDNPAEADRLAIAAILEEPDRGEAYALRGLIAARRGDAVTAAHHFRAAWLRGDRSDATRAAYGICLEVADQAGQAASVSAGVMLPPELETFSEVARMLGPAIRGIMALPLPPTGEPMLLPGERRPSGVIPGVSGRLSSPPRAAPAPSTPPRGLSAPFSRAATPSRPPPGRAPSQPPRGISPSTPPREADWPPTRSTGSVARREPSSPPAPRSTGAFARREPSSPPAPRSTGAFARREPSSPPRSGGAFGEPSTPPPSRPTGATFSRVPSSPPPPSRPSGAVFSRAPSSPPPPQRPTGAVFSRAPSSPPPPSEPDWSLPPRRDSGAAFSAPPAPVDDGLDWLEPRHTARDQARPSTRESWVDDSMVPVSDAWDDGPRFEASPLELVVDPGVPEPGVRSPVTGELLNSDEVLRSRQGSMMPELEPAFGRPGRERLTRDDVRTSTPPQPPVRTTRPLHPTDPGAGFRPDSSRPAPREEADLMEAGSAFPGVDRLRLALKLPGPVMTAAGARPQQLCVAVAFALTPDEVIMRDRQRPDAPPVRIAYRALARLDVLREGAQLTMTLADARQLHLDLRELRARAPALARVMVAELAASVRAAGMQVQGA